MAGEVLEYEELRIRLLRTGTGRYLVLANGPATGAAVVVPSRDPSALWPRFNHLIRAELGQEPAGGRNVENDLRELGREVFGLLLPSPVERCLTESRSRTGQMSPRRGLRLRFDLPDELLDLPVEILSAPAEDFLQTLAFDHQLSLVRSLRGSPQRVRLPKPEDRPDRIHVLAAYASPHGAGLRALEPEAELSALREGLDAAAATLYEVRATRDEIGRWLGQHSDQPTVVLLIAHGGYDQEQQQGVVYLETEDGGSDPISSDLLSGLLVQAQQLRLVVLNLCSGARSAGSEPFSGLAHALIGRGVPAVVAMQAEITEAAAALFSPALLEAVFSNCTIDEAMIKARRRLARIPRTTAIEWSTPVLFLHKECYHGLLFKAREVISPGREQVDPLRDGAQALMIYEGGDRLTRDILLRAARYLRVKGDWQRVLSVTHTRFLPRDQRWLITEAGVELAMDWIEDLCEILEAEQDLGPAAGQFDSSPELPAELLACLRDELTVARRLAGWYEEAGERESGSEWKKVLDLYKMVLGTCPLGYRDTVSRCDRAQKEVSLAGLYADAKQRMREAADAEVVPSLESLNAIAEIYQKILDLRPGGYYDAIKDQAYCRGRVAQAGSDWAEAIKQYGLAAGTRDAETRLAYATGRAAVRAKNWRGACDALAVAAQGGLPGDGWLGYVSGRCAEEQGQWQSAVDAYREVGDFEDASDRLCCAEGRLAADSLDWLSALNSFAALATRGVDGMDVNHWLTQAQDAVYDLASAAEAKLDWEAAESLFGALAKNHGLKDVGARHHYARGRAAQAKSRWTEAMAAFDQTEYADAESRRNYSRGRLCEEELDWGQAAERFAALKLDQLASEMRDAAGHLQYTRGRAADNRADWSGVLNNLSSLKDDDFEKEVGRRRNFARARINERDGEWDGVLEFLKDLTDEQHEGDVVVLRCKARGRLAELSADWNGAEGEYASVTSGPSPEIKRLGYRSLYARGRACGAAGNWDGACEAFSELPEEEYLDLPLRLPYAQACKNAEAAANEQAWAAVCTAYEALPGEFEDVAWRAGYARARHAEEAENWQRVIDQVAMLDERPRNVDREELGWIRDYAVGRQIEASYAWPDAVKAYGNCLPYRDSANRHAYAEGRSLEDRDEWRAAIEAYGRAPGHSDSAERRERLMWLAEALPWVDGLAGSDLVADPFAVRNGAVAYHTLRGAGITPGSTTDQVRDAAFALLERGGMTWHERMAWERMRSPDQRMAHDAVLYRLQDPGGLHRQLAALKPADSPQRLVERLCLALPEDAPLLLLLAEGRERAIEAWEERWRAAPGNLAVVHSLAVAHFWRAQELEDSGAWEHAESAWARTVIFWAVLVNDDDHWARWRQARAAAYTITSAGMARLRRELGQDLFDNLSAYGDRHAGVGRSAQAAAHRGLADRLEIELEGARVLKEAGGLAFHGGAGPVACGLAYLHEARLERPLGELVARLEGEQEPDADELASHRLRGVRCAFSELATAFMLVEHHRFEQALDALPPVAGQSLAALPPDCGGPPPGNDADGHVATCTHCQGFIERSPAYTYLPRRRARLLQDAADLAVRAHLELARAALAGGTGADQAIEEWTKAIEISRNVLTTVRTKERIVRMVLGRVVVLGRPDSPQRDESLDQAINLIADVIPVLRPVGVSALTARQAEFLTDRGVRSWYQWQRTSNDAYLARSAADLRYALQLNPESMRTRDNLVSSLLSALDEFSAVGEPGQQLRLLSEILLIVHDGLGRVPRHGGLLRALTHVLEQMESLLLSRLSSEELADLMDEYGAGTPGPEASRATRAGELFRAAERKRLGGDRPGALRDLIRAAWLDPADQEIRRHLLDLLEDQIQNPDTGA